MGGRVEGPGEGICALSVHSSVTATLTRLPPLLLSLLLPPQAGDHMAALRVLALTLRDVAAAEAYARAHLSPPDYRALLQLVLHPGPGLEPLWDDACYLIAALGRCGGLARL